VLRRLPSIRDRFVVKPLPPQVFGGVDVRDHEGERELLLFAGRRCTMVGVLETWESNTGSMRASQRFVLNRVVGNASLFLR
jgi:hypothetical protein